MKKPYGILLFLLCLGISISSVADGPPPAQDPTSGSPCEEPRLPIAQERLRELAKAETQKRERVAFTSFQISWGRNTCAWQVVASIDKPGPGENIHLMFSNKGKLLYYQGGT